MEPLWKFKVLVYLKLPNKNYKTRLVNKNKSKYLLIYLHNFKIHKYSGITNKKKSGGSVQKKFPITHSDETWISTALFKANWTNDKKLDWVKQT